MTMVGAIDGGKKRRVTMTNLSDLQNPSEERFLFYEEDLEGEDV
jgi:hypothetical protein